VPALHSAAQTSFLIAALACAAALPAARVAR
jgi:hypothetical protein